MRQASLIPRDFCDQRPNLIEAVESVMLMHIILHSIRIISEVLPQTRIGITKLFFIEEICSLTVYQRNFIWLKGFFF